MNKNTQQEKALVKTDNISRFSIGDTVNYCNGLIFAVASINEKTEICYDKRGMWYALVNCVKVS